MAVDTILSQPASPMVASLPLANHASHLSRKPVGTEGIYELVLHISVLRVLFCFVSEH